MTGATRFEIRVEPGADASTVAVSGDLDSGTCNQLWEVVEQELASGDAEKLVLDLRNLAFVDSAGMRMLIQAQREAQRRGVELEVLPAPDEVTALLRTAGVTERTNLVNSPPSLALEDFLERIDMELERDLTAPALSRAEIRDAFGSKLGSDQVATLVLLTSELMTNAVIHPRSDPDRRLGLRITSYPHRVRVEVDDPGDGFDPSVPARPTDQGGRGLMLVDRASACWGAARAPTPRGERFRVWFEVGLSQPEERSGDE